MNKLALLNYKYAVSIGNVAETVSNSLGKRSGEHKAITEAYKEVENMLHANRVNIPDVMASPANKNLRRAENHQMERVFRMAKDNLLQDSMNLEHRTAKNLENISDIADHFLLKPKTTLRESSYDGNISEEFNELMYKIIRLRELARIKG